MEWSQITPSDVFIFVFIFEALVGVLGFVIEGLIRRNIIFHHRRRDYTKDIEKYPLIKCDSNDIFLCTTEGGKVKKIHKSHLRDFVIDSDAQAPYVRITKSSYWNELCVSKFTIYNAKKTKETYDVVVPDEQSAIQKYVKL